jgi:hypothetical protein
LAEGNPPMGPWGALLLVVVLSAALLSPIARADLPLLMSIANEAEDNTEENQNFLEWLCIDVNALKVLRKGDWGAIKYRMGSKNLKTRFKNGILSVNAQFDYDGDHRVELDWPSLGGNFKLSITETDEQPVYRFSFKREF